MENAGRKPLDRKGDGCAKRLYFAFTSVPVVALIRTL